MKEQDHLERKGVDQKVILMVFLGQNLDQWRCLMKTVRKKITLLINIWGVVIVRQLTASPKNSVQWCLSSSWAFVSMGHSNSAL